MSYLEMKTISLELGQSSLPCPRWMIKEDKFQMALSGTQGISGSGMDKATKQYRQYIFKVNHKLSRKAARLGDASVADSHKVRGMLRAASKVQSQLQDSFPSAEPLWPWRGHLACIPRVPTKPTSLWTVTRPLRVLEMRWHTAEDTLRCAHGWTAFVGCSDALMHSRVTDDPADPEVQASSWKPGG